VKRGENVIKANIGNIGNIGSIGTISTYVKNMTLEKKWQERKKNPFMPKGNENSSLSVYASYKKQIEDSQKQWRIYSIVSKLKSGMKLSGSDMEYLKTHAPALYEEAVKIEKEREEYRRELEQCRTKEEVQRLNTQKMQQYLSEAKAISNSNIPAEKKQEMLDVICMRMAAIRNEHNEFIQTPEYQMLPSEYEEDEEKNYIGFTVPETVYVYDYASPPENYEQDEADDEIDITEIAERAGTQNHTPRESGSKSDKTSTTYGKSDAFSKSNISRDYVNIGKSESEKNMLSIEI
jgi:hypothetical protein